MKIFTKHIIALFAGLVISTGLTAGNADAATISFTDSVALRSTNFYNLPLTLSQFNPSLGTLTGIEITLDGAIAGIIEVESRDGSPTTIDSLLRGTIDLDWAGGSNITQVIPVSTHSFAASAYDGISDFGGTSGKTESGTGTDSDSVAYSSVDAIFADFIGSGTLSFTLSAISSSMASGPGNLLSSFQTNAAANVTITYTYNTEVPEPASMLLFGAGLMGLVGIGRRKIGKK